MVSVSEYDSTQKQENLLVNNVEFSVGFQLLGNDYTKFIFYQVNNTVPLAYIHYIAQI